MGQLDRLQKGQHRHIGLRFDPLTGAVLFNRFLYLPLLPTIAPDHSQVLVHLNGASAQHFEIGDADVGVQHLGLLL